MVAGEGIHPSDVRVGGMARNITELARKKLYARLSISPCCGWSCWFNRRLVEDADFPEGLGAIDQPIFASSNGYGDRASLILKDRELTPEAWYDDLN